MHLHGIKTRCYVCFTPLFAVDDYGDYNKWIEKNGKRVRKTDDRWFDPDWVIQNHIRKSH